MKFEWNDEDADIGSYKCFLYDDDNKCIDDIYFTDFTCGWHRKDDEENRFVRPYSFEASWCHGWSMKEGFDYDKEYNQHWDEDFLKETGWYRPKGGYQGECTHTVDDIKRWCENWLAQRYLRSYYNTLEELDTQKRRAEWFESQGFKLETVEA